MARPDRSDERRAELLPVITQAFVDLGYRRTTTAELARRTELRENQLYRLWPDKRAMFLAAIGLVYEETAAAWGAAMADASLGATPAERILTHESSHRGERGWYRITFAGLNEADDADVRKALSKMYRRFHGLVTEQVEDYRAAHGVEDAAPDAETTAWAIIGVGTFTDISKLLNLMPAAARAEMMVTNTAALLRGWADEG